MRFPSVPNILKSRSLQRLLAVPLVAGAGALALGSGLAGPASAATPSGASGHAAVARPVRHGHHPFLRARAIRFALRDSAAILGISPRELREDLRSGKSIADVAQSSGTTAQSVIDRLVSDARAKITAAVAKGRLTQSVANVLEAHLERWATRVVNFVPRRS